MLTPTELMLKLMSDDERFDHMSDDVRYRLPVSLWDGLRGEHQGKDAVRLLFTKVLTEFYDQRSPEVLFVVADEVRATVRFVMNATTTWGQVYRNDYYITIECEDGKIVAVDEIFDTKNLFDTMDKDKLGSRSCGPTPQV